ncbi:MAG: LysM peptidoglycan-binding domain-containing protein, partial [Roseovarius sp.]
MLRATLIAAGFVAITLALILLQPGKSPSMADLPPVNGTEVTRIAPDLSTLSAAAPATDPLVNSALVATLPALPAAPAPAQPQTAMPVDAALETMVLGALQQGQSEGYIDALVNDAARKGKVEVP